MSGQYDDIIMLPRPISGRTPMPVMDRAAQFAPFSALTGYEECLEEARRLTDERIEAGEEIRAALDRKQRILLSHIAEHPTVSVTYFVPDERKEGGAYVTVSGQLHKIDGHERVLVFTDKRKIPLDEIIELDCESVEV